MVQASSTVHFDQSEPIVFYYEQYQYNYEEPKNTLKKFKSEAREFERINLASLHEEILSESSLDVEDCDLEVNYEDMKENRGDSTKNKYKDEENMDIDGFDLTANDNKFTNNDNSGMNTVDVERESKEEENKSDLTKKDESQDKVTNATYFYRIYYHLIDITSDGSRFKCCNKTPGEPCDSCKVVEKLIFTYFDTTTLEDIGSERVSRGMCSHIYCSNRISKSGSKSKYKIDLISKSIYNREEYESFCSLKCLEENVKVYEKISMSPVETGSFTPRAMRCADNETLKKLHDNVFTLPECSSEQKVYNQHENMVKIEQIKIDIGTDGVKESGKKIDMENINGKVDDNEMVTQNKNENKNKEKRIETFEIYEDFESCDSESESSISEVNVKFDKNVKNLTSIYKCSESHEEKKESKEKEKLEQKKSENEVSYINQESLGIFSLLWYILSNLITKSTRELINSGVVQKSQFNEQFTQIYDCCLRDVPNMLMSTLKLHIQHILSTFKPLKDNVLNNKILEPLSQVIMYAVLTNRHHLPLNYSLNGTSEKYSEFEVKDVMAGMEVNNVEEMDRLKNIYNYDKNNEEIKSVDYRLFTERIERTLKQKYKLDEDSIDILLELFVLL